MQDIDNLLQSRECCNLDSPSSILSSLFTIDKQAEIWNDVEVHVLRRYIDDEIKQLPVPLDELCTYLIANKKLVGNEKIERLLYLGAILNDPKCQCQLSSCYRLKNNDKLWEYWAKKSAKQNCILGMISLLDWYIDQQPVNMMMIQTLLDNIIELNPITATEQNNIGISYLIMNQMDIAYPWLMKAALQGDIIAHYNLASCEYDKGNLEKALYWILLAIEKDQEDQDFIRLIIKIYTKLKQLDLADQWKEKLNKKS